MSLEGTTLDEMLDGIQEADKLKDIVKEKPKDVVFSNMTLSGEDVAVVRNNFNNYRILISDEIPNPTPIIKLGGRTIAHKADMSTMTGKAKSGKTYFLSAIITAALNPEYYEGHLEVNLPTERPKIIWIDTEQSDFWSQQILYRVKRSGVSPELIDDNIIYLNCRDLSVNQIKAVTYVAMDMYSSESAFLILDGSRDLVESINDDVEAKNLSRWLPEMAKKYDMNISTVLHQNPAGGEGSKLRGTLGTEFMNKSEFTVEIKVHEKDKDVYIASSMLSRDIGSDEHCFIIEDGILQFTDAPVADSRTEKSQQMHQMDIDDLKLLTREVFKFKTAMSQANLRVKIQGYLLEKQNMNIGLQKIVAEWLPHLDNKGLIKIDEKNQNSNGKAKYWVKSEFADTETAPF